MEQLAFLTTSQIHELDRMCKQVAEGPGWGRVSVVIENGRPRWVETAVTRAIGTEERGRPPPGSPR